MINIQIGFTLHKRPNYLSQVSYFWKKCRGFNSISTTCFIEPTDKVDEMVELAKELGAISLNTTKLGVLVNPWHTFETLFLKGADFVIIAEEDVIVSNDSLEYLLWAAKSFEHDLSILGVCGHGSSIDNKEDPGLLLKKKDMCPWLWGTWKDRWYSDIRDTWDKDYSSGIDGSPSGWDWNLNLRITKERFWLYPAQTRSAHIGQFEGVHMTPELWQGSNPGFVAERDPCTYHLFTDPSEHI